MTSWKRLLLEMYVRASMPLRIYNNRRAAASGAAPVMVLFYHRIADDGANAWTCPFDMFARQMRWLKRRFDMISLREAQERIRRGRNRRPSVTITFDDGYADNCHRALPLLIEYGIPCTYFVASRFVLGQSAFPHDVARGMPLRPNTLSQLREMASAGIEIGAHTRTHADLGKITDTDRLVDEIVGSRDDLQSAIDRPVRHFAFPFGGHENLNPAAFHIARDAGFESVCSAYGGYNLPGGDDFHLQRIHGDDDFVRLRNWVTIDPRKLRTPRFDYHAHRLPAELAEVASS